MITNSTIFFRAATPIDVIEKMQIGSRSIWECANSGSGVLSIRSTPWVFAWSQARYFLPGWYGAGSALQGSLAAQGLPQLREVYRDWPFFALVIDDIEAQLARTDLAIAERYGELASPGLRHYMAVLREEFQRTREAVLAVKDESDLLDGDRTQQRAIQLRNPYVDPHEPDAGGPAAPLACHRPRGRGPVPRVACQRQRYSARAPDDRLTYNAGAGQNAPPSGASARHLE